MLDKCYLVTLHESPLVIFNNLTDAKQWVKDYTLANFNKSCYEIFEIPFNTRLGWKKIDDR